LAFLAVAASVLLTRFRQARPVPQEIQPERPQGPLSLDALRQAGF
jgi:hypothetical protein